MRIKWIRLSEKEAKALHIILRRYGLTKICEDLDISKGTIFNKLNGKVPFREKEIQMILCRIGITQKELQEFAEAKILKFL